jgi:Fic family protein
MEEILMRTFNYDKLSETLLTPNIVGMLTLLLLYRAGYIVGKYISIEKLIENSKDTYYEVLHESSEKWHDNGNNYIQFVQYFLGILLKAYSEFEERVEYLGHKGMSKPDRIKLVIERKLGKLTKREIMQALPDVSKVTVERTLTAFQREGYIANNQDERQSHSGRRPIVIREAVVCRPDADSGVQAQ